MDVFVLERGSNYTVTDFGDALGWMKLQSISRRHSRRQEALVQDLCRTLRIELIHDQLILGTVPEDALEAAVSCIAQAVVQISDSIQSEDTPNAC